MHEVSAVVLASTRRPDGQGKGWEEVTFGLKMDDTGVHCLHFRVIICP